MPLSSHTTIVLNGLFGKNGIGIKNPFLWFGLTRKKKAKKQRPEPSFLRNGHLIAFPQIDSVV